jgi:Putative transposase
MIVPGGSISLDGERWIACRPRFFLHVGVLSSLFRRLVLEKLAAAHCAGQLQFFGKHAALTNARAFAAYLACRQGGDPGAQLAFGGWRAANSCTMTEKRRRAHRSWIRGLGLLVTTLSFKIQEAQPVGRSMA